MSTVIYPNLTITSDETYKLRFILRNIDSEIAYNNLKTAFFLATESDKLNGENWYQVAHNDLKVIHNKYQQFSFEQICAVCAVISPLQRWWKNLENTEIALQQFINNQLIKVHMFQTNNEKVWRILELEYFDIAEFINPKTSPKVFCFYQNLLNPDNQDCVTIDSFMGMAACGLFYPCNLKMTNKALFQITKAMEKLAAELEMPINELQAVIWNVAHTHQSGTSLDLAKAILRKAEHQISGNKSEIQ